mgnify:FL=1
MGATAAPPILLTRSEIQGDIANAVREAMRVNALATQTATVAQTTDPPAPAKPPASPPLMANAVLSPVVNTLDNIKVFREPFPIGSALIGLPSGVIIGEVIDGFVPKRNKEGGVNPMNIAAQAAAAYTVLALGDKLIGRSAAQFAAGIVIVRVASQLLPIDKWIADVVAALRGIAKPKAGQDAWAGQYSVLAQAEAVASQAANIGQIDHYSGAL